MPAGALRRGGIEETVMGLRSLLGSDEPSGNLPRQNACPHPTLTPRWRGPEVMDDDSKAMGWICHRCHKEFLPHEVRDRRPLAHHVGRRTE